MAKPIVYFNYLSPSARSVLLIAKAINLDLEKRHVDLAKLENFTPEFTKLNPHRIIPTLNDNGHILWDSHAICTYLIGKYAKSDCLYPKDLAKRSIIDQRLHFDSSIMFPAQSSGYHAILLEGKYQFTDLQYKKVENAYRLLDILFQDENQYAVGNTLTVADYVLSTVVTQLESVLPIDKEKFANILKWIDRMHELPYFYDMNTIFVAKFKYVLKKTMEANKALAEAN